MPGFRELPRGGIGKTPYRSCLSFRIAGRCWWIANSASSSMMAPRTSRTFPALRGNRGLDPQACFEDAVSAAGSSAKGLGDLDPAEEFSIATGPIRISSIAHKMPRITAKMGRGATSRSRSIARAARAFPRASNHRRSSTERRGPDPAGSQRYDPRTTGRSDLSCAPR